jgi:hypothetical protein
LNLNIFKKDSTFSTAQQAVKLYYQLDQSQRIGAGIRLQQSNGISDNIALAVEDFDSQFYNLNYSYIKRQKKDALFPIKTQLEIALAFGKRNGINSVEQRQSQIKGSHILNLNLKNSIFLKLHLEELQSKAYLFNELVGLLPFAAFAKIVYLPPDWEYCAVNTVTAYHPVFLSIL